MEPRMSQEQIAECVKTMLLKGSTPREVIDYLRDRVDPTEWELTCYRIGHMVGATEMQIKAMKAVEGL